MGEAIRHMPALDGLRGLAAWLVVAYHGVLVAGLGGRSGPLGAAVRVLQTGWVGVDLFFALSGFLVTGILLRTRDREGHLKTFFARRVGRIVPLYFVLLLVMLHVVPWLLGEQSAFAASLARAREHELTLWTFTVNLWMAATNTLIGGALEPCWSLCVEVHYYLLWPLLVGVCTPRQLVRVCLGLLVASVALRAGLHLGIGVDPRPIYFATPTRLDAVIVGTLFAARRHMGGGSLNPADKRAAQRLLLGSGVALTALFVAGRGLHERSSLTVLLGYTVIALFAGAAVAAASELREGGAARVLCAGPLSASGRYSYAIYLFNLPLFTLLAERLPTDLPLRPWLLIATGAALSYLLAMISYRLIELPFQRLSHRV